MNSLNKRENIYEWVRVRDHKRLSSNDTKRYDKVIIKNCLKFFEKREREFCAFLQGLLRDPTQQKASLLVIQRVSDLNTLPYSNSIAANWSLDDVPYTKFMETFQALFFTLTYDIETFKNIVPCKSLWYNQIAGSRAYPLNVMPSFVDHETNDNHSRRLRRARLDDIREINEGVLKYHPFDESVEISDRMLFIGAHRPVDREHVIVERMRRTRMKNRKDEFVDDREADKMFRTLYMEVTPEMRDLITKKK